MLLAYEREGLINKPFSYYDELAYVFGYDRVTGHFVETFADVGSNESVEYERFDMPDGNEEYNQGIDMSQENVCASRPSRVLEGRIRSNRSKRKRGSQREGKLKVIHMTLECTNDQLRTIVE
ncbi:retrotransposon protein [Cucumis melo var. makuwa]|uniref:Retrotransposon protein n=2 Tax=Cucumis melo TaxID=3656 RepID=A0A5A7UUA3_CUCMM|nr:retrotransposon protein [Cucumis melo var. makuwa]